MPILKKLGPMIIIILIMASQIFITSKPNTMGKAERVIRIIIGNTTIIYEVTNGRIVQRKTIVNGEGIIMKARGDRVEEAQAGQSESLIMQARIEDLGIIKARHSDGILAIPHKSKNLGLNRDDGISINRKQQYPSDIETKGTQTVFFTEDFESHLVPGQYWKSWDSDTLDGLVYWCDSNTGRGARAYGGSWSMTVGHHRNLEDLPEYHGAVIGDGGAGTDASDYADISTWDPSSSSWYKFEVYISSVGSYTFSLDWDSSENLDLYIYKPDGTLYGAGRTTSKPETMTVSADVTGWWYIVVDDYTDSSGAVSNFSFSIGQDTYYWTDRAPTGGIRYWDNIDTYAYWNSSFYSTSGYDTVLLAFYAWYDMEENYDYLYAGFLLDDYTFYPANFSGSSNGWVKITLRIPDALIGQSVTACFEFDSDSLYWNYEGVYIDNISMVGADVTLDDYMIDPEYANGQENVTVGWYVHNPTDHTIPEANLTIYFYQSGQTTPYAIYYGTVDLAPGYHWYYGEINASEIATFPEGWYDVEFKIWSGNVDESRLWDTSGVQQNKFCVDKTSPSVSIDSPSNGDYVKGTVTIQVTWSDANPENCTLYIDGKQATYWTTTGTQTYSWDTTTYTDGFHTIEARAYDKAGNSASTSITVTVDNTKPTVSIDSPKDNDVVGGTVTIQVTWNDAHPDRCELYIGGSLVTTWYSNGTVTYSWDTTTYSDGSYVIQAVAYDSVGNSASTSITVTVDNTAPSVDITSPENGSTVGSTFDVVWNASDVNSVVRVEVYLDGVLDAVYLEENMSNSHTFSSVSSGWHNVSVLAFDVVGNVGSDSIDVYVISLSVEILDPKNGSFFNVSWVNVSWDASGDVDHFEIYLDGAVYNDSVSADVRWYNVSGLSEASHEISVFAVSSTGDRVCDNVTIIMDFTPPSVSIISPSNDTYFNVSTVDVYWSGSDENLDRYLISCDGGSWMDVGLDTSYSFSGLKEGSHNVSVKALDKAGNSRVSIVFFYVDISPPSIQILFPSNNTYTNSSSVLVSWNGTDNYGIDHYEVRSGDSSWINVGLITSYTFDLSDGNNTIYVKAVDYAGNIGHAIVFVVVDTVAPDVNICSPGDGEYLHGVVNILLYWNDTNPDKCELYINYTDKPVQTFYGVGNQSYDWNTSDVDDGAYSISVIAFDRAGNKAVYTIGVIVDNTAPIVSIESPKEGYVGGTIYIQVYWGDENPVRCELFIDGASKQNFTNTGTCTYEWDTRGAADGDHTILVRTYDKAGNTNEDVVSVTVDNSPPSISIIDPENNSNVVGSFTVYWNATDNTSYVDRVYVYLNDSLEAVYVYGINMSDNHTFEKTYGNLCIVRVVALDAVGNNASDEVFVYVFSISIEWPSSGYYTNKTWVLVNWSYTGSPENFSIYLGYGDESSLLGVVYPPEASYNVTGMDIDGEWNITVVAMDADGNKAWDCVIVHVDLKPPSLAVEAPYGFVRDSIDINVTWSDENPRYCSLLIYYEDGILYENVTWMDYQTGSNIYTWDTSKYPDGNYTLKVVARDMAGNINRTMLLVTVDNTPPNIWMVYPDKNNTIINQSEVRLEWDAVDNLEVDYYLIRIDQEDWIDVGSSKSYTYNFSVGNHTVRVRAYDHAGNFGETIVVFEVRYKVGQLIIALDKAHYTVNYSDPLVMNIHISTPDGEPASNITVWVYVFGNNTGVWLVGSATTNQSGDATLAEYIFLPPDNYTLLVNCSGYALYAGAAYTVDLNVCREQTRLKILNEVLEVQNTDSIVIMCRLTTNDDENISGTVNFMLVDGEEKYLGTVQTDSDGFGTFIFEAQNNVGEYWILARYDGSKNYTSCSVHKKLRIIEEGIELMSLTFSKDRIYVGDSVAIEIVVVEDDDVVRYIEGADVLVYANGEKIAGGLTDHNGGFSCVWKPERAGDYEIKFVVKKDGYGTLEYRVTRRVLEKMVISPWILIAAVALSTGLIVFIVLKKRKRGVGEAEALEPSELEVGELEEIE